MAALGGQFSRDEITIAGWYDGFSTNVRNGHTESYFLGRRLGGDLSELGAFDAMAGRRAADLQSDFILKFRDDLETGRYIDEEGNFKLTNIELRSNQYVMRMRATSSEAFVDTSEDDEQFELVLGPVENCPDCISFANDSPWSASEIYYHPGDGSTQCKVNCHCEWLRIRDGVSGFSRVSI